MGIADLFRPKYRHSDVRVRTEAVRALGADDATILKQIAKSDRDIGVRRIAIEKIEEADVLAELAAAESERSLRDLAGERAARLWQTTACGDDAEKAGSALGGLIDLAGKLGDQDALVGVVAKAELAAIRKRAFGELREARALAALAKSDAPQELRTAAVARIDDGDVLRAIAIDTTVKEVGLAAVEKLEDVERLEQVAQKAKNKAVRQKARKIVGEIQDAERAKKPGVSDDVKRKRAERAQLLREVEAVVESFDFAKSAEIVRKAEAAWAALGEEANDDRFAKTVERFWKRKEIHEQQARSSDELRAIEREAREAKDRAAAERTPKPVAPPVDEAEPGESDAKREAREAEAKARREEREKAKAEDDARRAAQQAERAAKQKEDAERGAAVAASLEAMCQDMEQLAGSDNRDTRAIDRLLAQAAKAFEQVAKVANPQRDTLADRYTAARGKLVTKSGELREAEDWQRWTNVPKAEALIQTAKEMLEAPATPDLGNRLRQLQALWKEVGPMPQRRSKELWETFKTACDQVYEKVRGVRAVEQEKFVEVAKVKEALIAEAEAIADSTDFAATAEKLKALQAQWKQSGYLPRKQGDELWKRFRTACDRFFERRKPLLDAQHEEQAENLRKKQELIARATAVANGAGEGTWGKAIGEIKDLQAEWKEIGHVPRRDADAVYKAFRAACDSLFAKRDAARDAEANAHRAEIDALKAEIDGVIAGGDDVVGRALAARAKAREVDALGSEVEAMVRHVLEHHRDTVKNTELDPARFHDKREKLIARVEELMPKQPAAPQGADVAAQLKAAMRQNAFGDLRWSGRDPVEVLDDLKQEWNEIGPILTDDDHAQADRFEAAIGRVLEAHGRQPRAADDGAGERRRRRRDRHSGPPINVAAQPVVVPVATTLPPMPLPEPSPLEVVPDAHADATTSISGPEDVTATATPISAHDAVTQPAKLPPELPHAAPSEPEPVVAAAEPPRRKSLSQMPAMTELDDAWDLGDEDPTAKPPAEESPPSSFEMAGDGSAEGDGLDSAD